MQAKARHAQVEIEAYSCIVIDEEVNQHGYLADSHEWFLEWLFRLRLGSGFRDVFEKRVDFYRSPTREDRRMKFVSVLQHTMPDSRRAPLLYCIVCFPSLCGWCLRWLSPLCSRETDSCRANRVVARNCRVP